MMVPIQVIRWYRMQCYGGTDSCATVVPIRRYCQFIKSLVIVTYGIRDGRSINVDEWFDMKIVIPTKEQQRHIVRTIKVFENKIENEEIYASCLLKQKQHLLRQMFI